MVDQAITEVTDRINSFFGLHFGWVNDPLIMWFGIAFAILVVLSVVSYFFPFNFIRVGAGAILVVIGAFLAGGVEMRKTMNKKLKDEQAKQKKKLAQQKPPQNNNQWGNWFGQ